MKCNIGELIDQKGLKKKFVAEVVGVSPQQLSNWLSGRNYPPLDKAYKLAKLLECKVDELYKDDEE
ncbi:helix-turn-helix transcriptional regulator [Peribacillus kribbensis]|uniref:helix-turn-helix transcriptional regulator n=1 Tax=Peribacillus kribbensis TaxID=356658 RepID=UPI000554EE79|nr:helix-turn-helix transcriptional regulator [Peribacillus kribbensis]